MMAAPAMVAPPAPVAPPEDASAGATYEVVAPKGALLRAKADKSSEMLGIVPCGTRVVVDRTLKLTACGTKRARLVAPLGAGVAFAWCSLKILARRRGPPRAVDGAAGRAANEDGLRAAAAAAMASCSAAAAACRSRADGAVESAEAALDGAGFGVLASRRRRAFGPLAFLAGAEGDAVRVAIALLLAERADAVARTSQPRSPARRLEALVDAEAGLEIVARTSAPPLECRLFAAGAAALHALGRFVEAGNWWRRSGRCAPPKGRDRRRADSGAAHAERLAPVLDAAEGVLGHATGHAHLLDTAAWAHDTLRALEDLVIEAPACSAAKRLALVAYGAAKRWDDAATFAATHGADDAEDGFLDDAARGSAADRVAPASWTGRGVRGVFLSALARTNAFDEAAAALERWRERWDPGADPTEDPDDPFSVAAEFAHRAKALRALRDAKAAGDAALRAGDSGAAVECYGAALARDADHARIRYNRGLALTALGRHKDAAEDFTRAVRGEHRYHDASLALARSYVRLGRHYGAAKFFRDYLDAPHDDPGVREELRSAEARAPRKDPPFASRPTAAPPRRSRPLAGKPADGTHYATLEVAYDASESTIKRRFHELALKYHPDKNASGEARFKLVNAAHECLSDVAKRRAYDTLLRNAFED